MLYPSILKNTMGMIECVQMKAVGNEKECPSDILNKNFYYYQDQSIRCFDDRHNLWLAALFVPALIFYVLLIPILFTLQIRKNKIYIFAGPTLHRVIWGFVTSGYDMDEYFWEMVVLARKAVLVFVMVFVRPAGPMMTALCCVVTLLFALVAHSQWMPFVDYHIDLLEKVSLVCNIIMILLGLMLNYTTDSQALVVSILIATTNIGFFGIALRMKIGSKIAEAKRKKARKLHQVKPTDFAQESDKSSADDEGRDNDKPAADSTAESSPLREAKNDQSESVRHWSTMKDKQESQSDI
jgi:hypothetical protein